MAAITEHDFQQAQAPNESGRPPVVFVHGLWLLPRSSRSRVEDTPSPFDRGCAAVADIAITFIRRFVPPAPGPQ